MKTASALQRRLLNCQVSNRMALGILCWCQVLPGRTQNGVKNHWHATLRKVSRAPLYANPSTPLQAYLRELNIGAIESQIWNKSQGGMSNRLPTCQSSIIILASSETAAASSIAGYDQQRPVHCKELQSKLPKVFSCSLQDAGAKQDCYSSHEGTVSILQ